MDFPLEIQAPAFGLSTIERRAPGAYDFDCQDGSSASSGHFEFPISMYLAK